MWKWRRAILQASSPGSHARQTSGLRPYTSQKVEIPTLPTSAEHRSPKQRMPDDAASTNCRGMRLMAASVSSVKRGQSREKEQHAPHVRQPADLVNGSISLAGTATLSSFISSNTFVPVAQRYDAFASAVPIDLPPNIQARQKQAGMTEYLHSRERRRSSILAHMSALSRFKPAAPLTDSDP
jgi:hypothetical protein